MLQTYTHNQAYMQYRQPQGGAVIINCQSSHHKAPDAESWTQSGSTLVICSCDDATTSCWNILGERYAIWRHDVSFFLPFVEPIISGSSVVHIYPVEPNLCDKTRVTDSILGEYIVDENTSMYWPLAVQLASLAWCSPANHSVWLFIPHLLTVTL